MAHILVIGIATIDIINSVNAYPQEDSEIRASAQNIRRGGNAANSAVILSQLGHLCSWAGTLSDDKDGEFITRELQRYGIDTRNCCHIHAGITPTSYITHNRSNGSRTIIHHRDLPEFSFDNFRKIDLSHHDWLHLEGRHCQETAQMIHLARQQQPQLPVSIEIEKQRPDIEALFELGDLLLFSRSYAQDCGYLNGEDFLHAMRRQAGKADLVCAWGEKGAWALTRDNDTNAFFSPAFPPPQLINTLAAGDTFNAAIIDARCKGQSLTQALTAACHLAGQKCGFEGLNLTEQHKKSL